MGSTKVRALQSQIKNLKMIETQKGYEFNALRRRIKKMGASDYEMKKAIIYRENYLKEMEKYSHFENYQELMAKLKSIQNPLKFFEFVSQNELTQDLTYQSDQYYSQQEFNRFVEMFQIEPEQYESSIDYLKQYKKEGSIEAHFKNKLGLQKLKGTEGQIQRINKKRGKQ